jgi:hypothetical protein
MSTSYSEEGGIHGAKCTASFAAFLCGAGIYFRWTSALFLV